MAAVGSACLFVGLLTAVYAVGASLYGARAGRRQFVVSARRAMYCLAGLLVLFASVVLRLTRRGHREIAPYATAVLGAIAAFFLLLMVVWESPFETLASPPPEGNGLNPLLR